MILAIIERVIRFRWIVVGAVAALAGLSVYALRTSALDAIPDISDPQIIVYAKWPRSPQVIEADVTRPLVRAFSGSPDVRAVRGTSHMGYSFVYVVLRDPARRAVVRQYVADRLSAIRAQLPPDAIVTIGPNASSMGWVFQYAVLDRNRTHDLRELRLLNEGVVKPALQAADGVAEIASVGGLEKQYQVKLFPPLLSERKISLTGVIGALQGAFQEAGGRTIEVANREYQLRGGVDPASIDRLELLVVGRDGYSQPVRLSDVGYVQVGYDLRRGIADLDGTGEVVGGIAVMEQGGNVLAVTRNLLDRLAGLKASLPDGVEIVPTYDRSALIWETLRNFAQALLYELAVVILVIAIALRNLRAAAAPIFVLLLGTLFTVLPMAAFGQTINLFSLAGLAIAIGEMADATIVIVENCTAQLAAHRNLSAAEKVRTIIRSTATMTRPLLFSMLIIVTSFLPIFFLGDREGRLFNPLAFTKTSAMAFSTLLTLFLLPIVIVWVFRGKAVPVHEREGALVRAYRALLTRTIRRRYLFVSLSAVLVAVGAVLMAGFQKDYMPEMEEGSILYMPTTLPGLPSREAGWILQQMDAKLKAFPEVSRVFGKLGRADTATDPAPVAMIETTVTLKPPSEWRPGMTKDKLIAEMNAAMEIVGYVNSWSQPINTRVMMQDTGIQTPVGIKVKGPQLATVQEIAQDAERLLRNVPGTQSVIAERISQGYFVDARLDLERMAQHGVTVDDALPTIRFAIGGDNVINVRQADDTIVPLAIQYSPEYIDTLDKVRQDAGRHCRRTLRRAERDRRGRRPRSARDGPQRQRRAGRLHLRLPAGRHRARIRGSRARATCRTNLTLPAGYSLEWTGLYTYAEEARSRLIVVVPLTLIIMFGLLLMAFRSLRRQLADHVVGAVRAGRWRPPSVAAWILDDDRRDHRLRVAVCGRDPDRYHHDRVHPRRAQPPHGGAVLHGRRRRGLGHPVAAEADDGGDDGPRAAADHARHAAPAWTSPSRSRRRRSAA